MISSVIFTAPRVQVAPRVIYTLRHGQSEGNARGLDDESLKDTPNHLFPLTKRGEQQILQVRQYIKDNALIKPTTGFYTSSFFRAQQTIGLALGGDDDRKYSVSVDTRLDEWWKGIFHSLSEEEIERYYPVEKRIKEREGWHHYRPPQGQAGKDVELNLLAFLREAYEEEIFLSGHGRSFAFLRRLLTNQPTDSNCNYPYPKNGEIWKFTRECSYYAFKSLFIPQ